MAEVVLDHISKVYAGGVTAVDDVSLAMADGSFVVLVGPSGCGKSTTLRMIAGLEEITSGTLSIGGRVVNDVPPKDRDIAMVFQSYALYPHMSVYKNMAFGLKLRRVPKAEIDRRVRDTAAMLGLTPLLDRKPKALSGGQRQRVAVGRAIVRDPKVFLFDEPLSNLDAKLRVETRAELKQLHARLRTTTVYVTHDQEEAMTLGDVVVVMSGGRIQQAAPPLEVYARPANRFVAAFVGMPPMNFFDGRIETRGGAGARPRFVGDGLDVALGDSAAPGRMLGAPVVLGVRPEGLHLRAAERAHAEDRTVEVKAHVVEPLGGLMDVHATTSAGKRIVARVRAEPVDVPAAATWWIEPAQMHLFEPGEYGSRIADDSV